MRNYFGASMLDETRGTTIYGNSPLSLPPTMMTYLGPVHTMAKLREEKRLDQWKCKNAQSLSSRAFTLKAEVQRTSPPKEPRWQHF